ncbi:DUF2971 domain-containing protein [Peribacillus asahii]|uniref:DUF2971 domain-containing protein n=1 Tax=Peribacillus asahii TaxID=228899 RepID=A0A398B5V1_9BACI|nr:DUF2971 domain-containing protein [Peribacillus asahii]RID85315.1 DUF2971 domain-containing protein [Peribacillus asahii]USK59391.1 DUF2971 domain-containing protein [Peribacillus asahii]
MNTPNMWMKNFFEMYMKGDRDGAYRLKHMYIPQKLYKYQSLSERNINSIKNGKLWFCNAKNLNDPFDCKATYFNEEELLSQLKNRSVIEKKDVINKSLDFLQSIAKVTCFTEDPFNMPMWAHYGDNHEGICVEYDLTQLPYGSDFSNGLYPVGYEDKRYDVTNLLKMTFEEEPNQKLALLFFLMLLKHKSWSYEKEWRIILPDERHNGGLENFPIKPTAVYFGLNSSQEEIENAKLKLDKDIKFIKLNMHNSEFFNLDINELA